MTNHHAPDLQRAAAAAEPHWKDEQDRADWYENKAYDLAARCDVLEARLARCAQLLIAHLRRRRTTRRHASSGS